MSISYSNEEMVCAADDAINSIIMAVDELSCIDEYEDIKKALEEQIEELKDKKEPYEQEWEKEQKKEFSFLNLEYEKSR